jgi:hypothetical protein
MIPCQLKWRPGEVLRVFLYDGDPQAYNTIQAIEIDLGNETIDFGRIAYTGQSAQQVIARTITQPTAAFPPTDFRIASLVVPHGDYRLTTIPLKVGPGVFVRHGNSAQSAHSIVEPIVQNRNVQYMPAGGSCELAKGQDGLFGDPGIPNMNPFLAPHFAPVNSQGLASVWTTLGIMPSPGVIAVASSSSIPGRRERFAHGRRDGQYAGKPINAPNSVPNRGSSDPLETGDFDTGVGLCPAGAYMNQPDDGDARDPAYPYYQKLDKLPQVNPATFSPNRVLRSPVDFGSISSGLQARVPWQTLRFRPDPGMYHENNRILKLNDQPKRPSGYQHFFPFSNYCGPKDHLLLDMFWMPIVEPWAISEAFATKGLINLNQQIYPFTYIQRTTALHALLRSERMMAIPDSAANDYKDGSKLPDDRIYRHWINAKETIKQLTEFRWRGLDPEGFDVPFNSFRSASEICELWLVPEQNTTGSEGAGTWNLNYIIREFWERHRITGDNMRERPYSNLYPRVTVRSNCFKVHMIAQTLKQASTNDPTTFNSVPKEGADPDLVTAEWRGSALIERVLNPNEPELQTIDYAPPDNQVINENTSPDFLPKLDNFYTYRVTEVKQFTE